MQMFHIHGVAALLLLSGTAMGGVGVQADTRVEVSETGLDRVVLEAVPHAPQGWAARSGGVPFAAVPDWQLDLRRQIGGLQIADLNGDGLLDLAAICYISSSFPPYTDWHDMVFYNTGTELEAAPSWLSGDQRHTGDIQIGDVNGDTHPDLVTIHGGGLTANSVRIYFGSAIGPSTAHAWQSSTPQNCWGTSGLLIDLDKDNDLDLVTTNQATSPDPFRPMYQFENNAGTLDPVPVWQSAEQSIQNGLAAGDFDNDTWPDVGVAKWVNFESGIYRNNNGTLESTPAWTVGHDDSDKGASWSDVDDNGWLDLAIGGDPARLFSNNGGGVLTHTWSANPPHSGPQDFRFHDVDHDGDDDLCEIHFGDGRAHIYLNNDGVLDTEPSWTYDASQVGTALALGDINGDGRDDLVLGYSGDPSIRVFYAQVPDCLPDLTGDGVVDSGDLGLFITAFLAGDLLVDFTGDGIVDAGDLGLFIDLYLASC